jgi:tetratricopeptide (TPR) repeat protein
VKNDRKLPLNPHLRNARLGRGWSQEQLAELVDTTSVNISRWENGSNFPTPYFRQKLCEVFGKTPAELGLVPTPSSSLHAHKVWTVPITRNPFFTGRETLLALLHERLSTARMAALTQAQALYGLGGIGKTQTAAEYAFRYSDEYAHVFWMRAATRETLAADFVKLAQLLDLSEKDGQDQPHIVAAVKRWLAANDGWLLILDNADELPLAQEFLPTSHQGYVLFTTRDHAAGAIAVGVEVENLTPRDSILLLLRWSKRLGRDAPLDQARAEDRAAAEFIAHEMDGLPLALVQAAAYVEETGCSLQDYLDLYAAHRKELLARRGRLMLDYPDTVAATWSLSFRRVEEQSPAAADVLRLCAFLAPDAIHEELLMRGMAEAPGADPEAEAHDSYRLNEALRVLLRYSLIRREENAHVLSIHRLVQTVLKESMDQETRRAWAERTVRVVNAALPEASSLTSENQQHYLRYYLPHGQECATLIAQHHLHSPEAAQLLFQAGNYLYFHGYYHKSQALHHQALDIRAQIFGSEHPAVADSLTALAILASNQGDNAQAERHYQQALAIRERTFGPDHHETTRSRNNLGVFYRNQGKYELAEQLLQQALDFSRQAVGLKHLDTLMIIINLAQLYAQQSKFDQAEHHFRWALTTGEQALGSEHPLIAHDLNLLARLSFERGDLGQAESLWKRSLAINEKALGPEHPATAERLNDLAELYAVQQRYSQALSFCQRALSIYERVLGPAHPDTISMRKHLDRIKIKIKRAG